MSDGPLGVHNYGVSTAYPAGIALAATWDPELASRIGASLGKDARARGVHFLLGPGMNIYRAPRVKHSEGVFVGYRHFDRSTVKPLFPFGYGLSYTTFGYSKLSVTPRNGNPNEPATVSFDVKNIGHRPGAEIAQLYVGDTHSSVPRPVKELKGFAKVWLKPGEIKRVSLTLDRRAFSYYDVNKKDWNAEPGDFAILVGSSSDKTELKGSFTLSR